MIIIEMQKVSPLWRLLILAPLIVTLTVLLTGRSDSQTRSMEQAQEKLPAAESIEQEMVVPEFGEAEKAKKPQKQPIIAPATNGPAREIDRQLEGTGLVFLPGNRGNAVPEEILEDKNDWPSTGLPVMDAP